MRLPVVLFATLIIAATSAAFGADEKLQVLSTSAEFNPRKMLYSFLQQEAGKHFDARRATIAKLKTPEDLAKRQQELRAKFIEAIGGFPEKTPLNAQVVGRESGDGFRLEKVIYESRPQHHVTAVLYLPEGEGPFPGVLVPCGHSANGKAAEAYQRVCILMAKNGLAVLCYDPIGQGERIQLLNEQGKPAIPGSTSEHSMVGVGALLVGQHTAGYRIWDGIRSLDYLASRPEVDETRLGCTGNSGGGTLTAYLMALDERIYAAAPSCYITTLERLFDTIGPQDAEQNITGQVAFGMEHADYVTMRAPKPTLICVGRQDFFDIDGAWTTFREAKGLYGMIGHGERVDLFEYDDKHGFSLPRRQAAMRWMRRWLLKKDDAPVETDFPIFTDAQLQCTRTGQVLDDLKGRSAFHLNAEKADELAAARAKRTISKEEQLAQVRQRIGLPSAISAANAKDQGLVSREGYQIRKQLYQTEPGVLIPGLLFEAKTGATGPLVIYLHGDGKEADAANDGTIGKRAAAGERVLALDLRGFGETSPNTSPPSRRSYFGADNKEAFLAQHLNRPLLGQRVYDVLSIVEALAGKGEKDLRIVGIGAAGPIALHAAALDPRIQQVELSNSLISWTNVVQTPVSANQLTNVVPGVLADYDFPELAATLAPRPLTLRTTVDAVAEPVDLKEVAKTYAPCRAAYETANAGGQFKIAEE